jgi:hypothetical protein
MIIKRSLARVLLVILLASLAIIGAVYARGPSLEDWPYTVERRPNGQLRVHVNVDMANRTVRDAYARQQRTAALAMARSNAGSIDVQVTFARPLSLDEARELAQGSGLIAGIVILEARDAAGELHTVGTQGTEPSLVDPESVQPGLEQRALRLIGVTMVRGTVPASPGGLGRLANDERVYLLDVMAHHLAGKVAGRYGVDASSVQVSVPSPHWYLSTER